MFLVLVLVLVLVVLVVLIAFIVAHGPADEGNGHDTGNPLEDG